MKSTRLKPLFGIRPGIYITAAAALLILLTLFLVLFLPGILRHGSVMHITTNAPGAAVYIDGTFVGSSPLEVFVSSGDRIIRGEKPFFHTQEKLVTVGGRILFSWFFPRTSSANLELTVDDPAGYLSWRLQDLYQWSLVTNYTRTYRYPEILADTARDIISQRSMMDAPAFEEFISFLPYLAGTSETADDIEAFSAMLNISAAEPGTSEGILKDAWFSTTLTLDAEEIEFIGIDSDEIEPFFISAGLISSDLFERFTQENPFWHRDNRDELVSQGLADDTYLYSSQNLTDRVIHVSFYAAQAFAAWLDEQYPGYDISLPNALQWEAASLAVGENQLYGLWQWTESIFYPGMQDEYLKQPELLTLSPHYLLKGGSSREQSGPQAALAPSVCSPVTGIRLVMTKE